MLSNYIEQVVGEDGGRKYKCVLCTQIFHKKEHIENHVENIHFPGTFQYNCKYCGQSFDRRNMLYKHHMSCEYKEKQNAIFDLLLTVTYCLYRKENRFNSLLLQMLKLMNKLHL